MTVKWAASLDGRAAAADGTSKWITGAAARQHVHEQRAAHDAILVGTGTVLADDPSLTARGDAGELLADQPLPVVVGDRPVPDDAAVRRHPRGLVALPGHDLAASLRTLRDPRRAQRPLVEGGPTVASALIAAGLVDELLVYLAPVLLGGPRVAIGDVGVGSIGDRHPLDITSTTSLGPDLLVRARPHRARTGTARPTTRRRRPRRPGPPTRHRTTGAPHDRRPHLPHPGSPVQFEVATTVPTTHGTFEMRAYRDLVTSAEHVAIIAALPDGSAPVTTPSCACTRSA